LWWTSLGSKHEPAARPLATADHDLQISLARAPIGMAAAASADGGAPAASDGIE